MNPPLFLIIKSHRTYVNFLSEGWTLTKRHSTRVAAQIFIACSHVYRQRLPLLPLPPPPLVFRDKKCF